MMPKPLFRMSRLCAGALLSACAWGGIAASAVAAAGGGSSRPEEPAHTACFVPGHWQVPGGAVLPRATVLEAARRARVVLLGENHDDAAHHRWQLDTLAALHRANPDLVLGAEMFPRRLQPVLDAWSRGELDDATFLQQTEWEKTWGFGAEMYMPIFRFARDHHIPLRGLNVERSEVRKVSAGGWAALDPGLRAELGTPAAPLEEYRITLRKVFDAHLTHLPEDRRPGAEAFERFVEAQLLWDRAMAVGIASQAGSRPVVAIMGSGHIRFGHGVPHQLRDLAITSVYSLVPLDRDEDCEEVREGLADVVVSPTSDPAAPENPHQPPAQSTGAQSRAGLVPHAAIDC
jgi:uncharacterized iron-regulated protein